MNLSELRRLAEAATPGPWRSYPSIHGNEYRYVELDHANNYTTLEMLPGDADLIAALSPELVCALVACVRAADTLVATLNNGHWKALAEYQSASAALDALLPEPPK